VEAVANLYRYLPGGSLNSQSSLDSMLVYLSGQNLRFIEAKAAATAERSGLRQTIPARTRSEQVNDKLRLLESESLDSASPKEFLARIAYELATCQSVDDIRLLWDAVRNNPRYADRLNSPNAAYIVEIYNLKLSEMTEPRGTPHNGKTPAAHLAGWYKTAARLADQWPAQMDNLLNVHGMAPVLGAIRYLEELNSQRVTTDVITNLLDGLSNRARTVGTGGGLYNRLSEIGNNPGFKLVRDLLDKNSTYSIVDVVLYGIYHPELSHRGCAERLNAYRHPNTDPNYGPSVDPMHKPKRFGLF
jgi:hypothetical protein